MLNILDRDRRLYQKLVNKYGEDEIISVINEMKTEKRRTVLFESKKAVSRRPSFRENFNVILTD